MIDDDNKGKWLVPLESQAGGCSLVKGPQQWNKPVEKVHADDGLESFSTWNEWSQCSEGHKMVLKQQEVDTTSIKVTFLQIKRSL